MSWISFFSLKDYLYIPALPQAIILLLEEITSPLLAFLSTLRFNKNSQKVKAEKYSKKKINKKEKGGDNLLTKADPCYKWKFNLTHHEKQIPSFLEHTIPPKKIKHENKLRTPHH